MFIDKSFKTVKALPITVAIYVISSTRWAALMLIKHSAFPSLVLYHHLAMGPCFIWCMAVVAMLHVVWKYRHGCVWNMKYGVRVCTYVPALGIIRMFTLHVFANEHFEGSHCSWIVSMSSITSQGYIIIIVSLHYIPVAKPLVWQNFTKYTFWETIIL